MGMTSNCSEEMRQIEDSLSREIERFMEATKKREENEKKALEENIKRK